MKYFRIGTLLFSLFLYQDVVQPNFFISHFSNELFVDEHATQKQNIQPNDNENVIIVENDDQITIYFANHKKEQDKIIDPIQNKLVNLNYPPKVQGTKSKRTRVGKRMGLLTGTMLYGQKS